MYCNVVPLLPVQLDQIMQAAVDSDQDSVSPGSLQNMERAYRQKLQVYQEAQKRQAQLVQKLQTKVTRNGPHCLVTAP